MEIFTKISRKIRARRLVGVIRGYSLDNKKLARLADKARLQRVLTGVISKKTIEEIKNSVNCPNCRFHKTTGYVCGHRPNACNLPKNYERADNERTLFMTLFLTDYKAGEPTLAKLVLYCKLFKEKIEKD